MKTLSKTQAQSIDSLKLLGDYWTLRIVGALRLGEIRFCELQRLVGNVNPVTLTGRLKKLEESKLINRTEESVDGCSVTYSLTELGHKALPVLEAINHFSQAAQ